MDFDLYQANKGTPMMTIENRRAHPLPAKEKREFSLLANSASLKKIKRIYLNNKKNAEETVINQEKKIILDYVSKLKDTYISLK